MLVYEIARQTIGCGILSAFRREPGYAYAL
jgi:hypothetical protein